MNCRPAIKVLFIFDIFCSASVPSSSTILPKSPTLSDTIEEEETKEDKENTEKESRHPSSMLPPQIDDITRSGASSPALSTGYMAYTSHVIVT